MSAFPYIVRITPDDRSGYRFWIEAPNNRTLAKGTRSYKTSNGAEQAARRLVKALATNGIEVIW